MSCGEKMSVCRLSVCDVVSTGVSFVGILCNSLQEIFTKVVEEAGSLVTYVG
jgi:uncharacterized protein with ATP-grasp and redox domains